MKLKLSTLWLLSLASAACLQAAAVIANSNCGSCEQPPAAQAAPAAQSLKLTEQVKVLQSQLKTYELRPIKLSASQTAAVPAETANFEIRHHSPAAIISVIISGLCFLSASLLIYVK